MLMNEYIQSGCLVLLCVLQGAGQEEVSTMVYEFPILIILKICL